MLENSLKIRGKFINKLVDKLEDLNSDLILIGKLDKKIYKKNNSQKGGNTANITQLQLTTYVKEQELKEEKKKLEAAIASTGNIGDKIKTMNAILQGINAQIQKFEIITPTLSNMNIDLNYLDQKELESLPNLIKGKDPWSKFSTNQVTKNLANKIGEQTYNKLINASSAPVAPGASTTVRAPSVPEDRDIEGATDAD